MCCGKVVVVWVCVMFVLMVCIWDWFLGGFVCVWFVVGGDVVYVYILINY